MHIHHEERHHRCTHPDNRILVHRRVQIRDDHTRVQRSRRDRWVPPLQLSRVVDVGKLGLSVAPPCSEIL